MSMRRKSTVATKGLPPPNSSPAALIAASSVFHPNHNEKEKPPSSPPPAVTKPITRSPSVKVSSPPPSSRVKPTTTQATAYPTPPESQCGSSNGDYGRTVSGVKSGRMMERSFRNGPTSDLGRSNSKKGSTTLNSTTSSRQPSAFKAPRPRKEELPETHKPTNQDQTTKRLMERTQLAQKVHKDIDSDHASLSDASVYESALEYQTDEEAEPPKPKHPHHVVHFAPPDRSSSPAFERDPRRWSSDSESEDEYEEDDLDDTLSSSQVDGHKQPPASARSKSILKNPIQQPLTPFQPGPPSFQRSYSSSSDSIKSVSSFKRSRHREDGPFRRADGSRTMRTSVRRILDTSQSETSSKPTRMSSLRDHQDEQKHHKLSRTASLLNKLKHPRGGKHHRSASVDTNFEQTTLMLTPPPTPSRFMEVFSSDEDIAPADPVQREIRMPTTLRSRPSTSNHDHIASQNQTEVGSQEHILGQTEPQAPQTRNRSHSNPAPNEVHLLRTLRGDPQKDTHAQGHATSAPARKESMLHKLNPLHHHLHHHHQAPVDEPKISSSATGVHLPSSLRDQTPEERVQPTPQPHVREPLVQQLQPTQQLPTQQRPAQNPSVQHPPLHQTPLKQPPSHPSPHHPGAFPPSPTPTASPTPNPPSTQPPPPTNTSNSKKPIAALQDNQQSTPSHQPSIPPTPSIIQTTIQAAPHHPLATPDPTPRHTDTLKLHPPNPSPSPPPPETPLNEPPFSNARKTSPTPARPAQ